MNKHCLLAGLLAVAASNAAAQAPPMDMNWGIQQQIQNQQMGDRMSEEAARRYLEEMQRLRRQGYTGPSLPTGVTPESLQRSIDGANDAMRRHNQSQQDNSRRQSDAVRDHDMRAIRGCSYGVDAYGQPVYVCP